LRRNFFVSGGDGLQISATEPEAAGQLPLREVMDTLPGFGSDSRIDSRNLGAAGQTVSRPVPDAREIKTDSGIENKVLLAGHVELLHDAVHGIVPTPV
jgi:hypothetical protein